MKYTEEAKEGRGPITSDMDPVYVLYSTLGVILGASKSYEEAKEARKFLEKRYPDMEILIDRADWV